MNEQTIAKLKEIQAIDHKIGRLNRQCVEKSNSLTEKQAQIVKIQQIINDRKEKAKKLKIEIDKKDVDLKTNEEKIGKLSVQMNTVRTNKEYSILTGEIKSIKADNDVLEDTLLNLFNQNDVIHREINDQENKLKDKKNELDNLTAKTNDEIKQLKQEIENIQEQRHKSLEQINTDTLRKYEKIIQNKSDNTALACVVKSHEPNEYRCSCCQMDIPPQQVVELKRNKQDYDIICCKSCSRILYVEEL